MPLMRSNRVCCAFWQCVASHTVGLVVIVVEISACDWIAIAKGGGDLEVTLD